MCTTLLQQQPQQQRQWRLAVQHLQQQGSGLGALIVRLQSCSKMMKEQQLRMQQQGWKTQGLLLLQAEGWQGLQHAVMVAWRWRALRKHVLQEQSSQAQR
jgi:hypothetical protein